MDSTSITPVLPVGSGTDGFGGGNFMGIFGLLVLLAFFNGGFGGFGNNNAAGFVGADVQRGFDQSSIMSGINGIQSTMTSSQMADMNQEPPARYAL